ncbi:NAD-dependent epimerase/dehydratase family protein [Phenylobacterium sp.]|uniref:NAD-dependent epimerase/dehydratase family protein n=1 Tax=Phenylobacterium sp. TaxID=1871053 RepID=UPI0025FA9E11|nr:NAD-dependent epimerase/dehydratase family protein [Phenylobacterium sp.]MCA3720446.1 NAD-dependent epimerase/dehydratase family protein [Phenylobacterium sp.]
MAESPRRALVTGGAGFIGRALAARLLGEGAEVTVLDDLSSGDASRLDRGACLMEGSVTDPGRVAEAMAGADAVFHLAAIASVARCNEDLAASHRVNLGGFVNVLEAAAAREQRPALVYASSAAVYGDNPETPLREDARPRPLSPYGADKLGCELHASAAATVLGLRSTGLRFFNVYGPGQDPGSPYSGVISRFHRAARLGEGVTIFGDGGQTRDFVFVDDVVEALLSAAAREKGEAAEVLNVCTGRETTVLDLAARLARLTGKTMPVAHAPARAGDIRRSSGDPARLEAILGRRPGTDLSAGLAQLVERGGD